MPINDGKYYDGQNRRIFPAEPFNWTAKYLESLDRVDHLERSGVLRIARRAADIESAQRDSVPAIIHEGCLPLGGSLETFGQLYERGMRGLSLFWPAGNHTGHVLDADNHLTYFARQAIARADDRGVVVDTCHLAHTPAFWDVLAASRRPTIHSHGAAQFPRAWTVAEGDLTDAQILAVAQRGRVIGIHFCTYIKNIKGWNWQPSWTICSITWSIWST